MKKQATFVLALFVLFAIIAVPAAQAADSDKGGPLPCLFGCLFGTRAGYQYNEGVAIRMHEWFMFIPILNFVVWAMDLIDIFGGTTWTEIVQKEHLAASNFDAWHSYAAIR